MRTALLAVVLLPCAGSPASSAGNPQACWIVQDELAATPSYQLGASVALSGDTLLIANEDSGTGARVYVESAGAWSFQQELLPSTPNSFGGFNHRVALDGDLAVTTDSGNYDAGSNAGAAFVFRRLGTTWSEETKLIASDAASGDLFGQAVALDGDWIAVGAPGRGAGAVYLFQRQGGSWVETQRIDVPLGYYFGSPLALEANTLAIRSSSSTVPFPSDAVLVYEQIGTAWTLTQTLPSPSLDLLFGASLHLSGDRLAVGSPGAQSNVDADAVFLYTRAASVWSLEATLSPPAGTGRFYTYGVDVALDGARLAVGASDVAGGLEEAGRVFVYALAGGAWSEEAVLQPASVSFYANFTRVFGWSLALDGTHVVVGDPYAPTPSHFRGGMAWVFASDSSYAPGVGYRNAGTNPVSYAAGEPRLGETLRLTVAPAMTGHSQALVFGFDGPGAVLLGGGQTLLCLDLGGSGQLFDSGFQTGPFAVFQVPIPYDLDLLGAQVCTQAVHAFGAPGFALSNAQDLRIGPPSIACP